MKKLFSTLALFLFAASLVACGGGSSSGSSDTSGSAAVTTLKIADTVVGSGATAANGNTLSAKYSGYLYDVKVADTRGKLFDAGTFSFKLGAGQVIAGWDQGLVGMKVGGKRTLTIPASLAYGASGAAGGAIPPNAALVFDVELLSVN